MAQRWIRHEGEKRKHGDGAPPEGADFHWVTETGSVALVNDVYYIDGQPAPPGEHVLDCGDDELPIDVDSQGKAQRRPKRQKQGGGNGHGQGRSR